MKSLRKKRLPSQPLVKNPCPPVKNLEARHQLLQRAYQKIQQNMASRLKEGTKTAVFHLILLEIGIKNEIVVLKTRTERRREIRSVIKIGIALEVVVDLQEKGDPGHHDSTQKIPGKKKVLNAVALCHPKSK